MSPIRREAACLTCVGTTCLGLGIISWSKVSEAMWKGLGGVRGNTLIVVVGGAMILTAVVIVAQECFGRKRPQRVGPEYIPLQPMRGYGTENSINIP